MFWFLYILFLVLVGLWISRTKNQILPNSRLPISSVHITKKIFKMVLGQNLTCGQIKREVPPHVLKWRQAFSGNQRPGEQFSTPIVYIGLFAYFGVLVWKVVTLHFPFIKRLARLGHIRDGAEARGQCPEDAWEHRAQHRPHPLQGGRGGICVWWHQDTHALRGHQG